MFGLLFYDYRMGAKISTLLERPLLIAEIGNSHFGDIKRARGLILQAASSGADLVKLQAIDETQTGSMPQGFYRQCAFSTDQYRELIDFGEQHNIPVFYTLVSRKHDALYMVQKYFKVAGAWSSFMYSKMRETEASFQTAICLGEFKQFIEFMNGMPVFASVPEDALPIAKDYDKAGFIPLFVSKYFTAKTGSYEFLENIELLKSYIGMESRYGYSDHTIGIKACEIAIKRYGCTVIEKHFTDKKNQAWNGHIFRDTVFAADNGELEQIAKLLGGIKSGSGNVSL